MSRLMKVINRVARGSNMDLLHKLGKLDFELTGKHLGCCQKSGRLVHKQVILIPVYG